MLCPLRAMGETLEPPRDFGVDSKCESLRENICRPYGTRIISDFTQHSACGSMLG